MQISIFMAISYTAACPNIPPLSHTASTAACPPHTPHYPYGKPSSLPPYPLSHTASRAACPLISSFHILQAHSIPPPIPPLSHTASIEACPSSNFHILCPPPPPNLLLSHTASILPVPNPSPFTYCKHNNLHPHLPLHVLQAQQPAHHIHPLPHTASILQPVPYGRLSGSLFHSGNVYFLFASTDCAFQ